MMTRYRYPLFSLPSITNAMVVFIASLLLFLPLIAVVRGDTYVVASSSFKRLAVAVTCCIDGGVSVCVAVIFCDAQ